MSGSDRSSTAGNVTVSDAALQELYCYATAGKGKDRDRVRLMVQAAGVSYERDGISLIEDWAYDRLGMWLGDEAATAIDWQTYPREAIELAGAMAEAKIQRAQAIYCFECWQPGECGCGEMGDGVVSVIRASLCCCNHSLQCHCATELGEPVFIACKKCGCRCFQPLPQ